MASLRPKDRAKFAEYVREVEACVENLEFLLDNLGETAVFDFSIDSLKSLETLYWKYLDRGIPGELSNIEQLAQLLCQYLGRCIIEHTGAEWSQSSQSNPMFGQPFLQGYGEADWDRVYPVRLAMHLHSLPETNPSYPGARERKVLARVLEKAIGLHERSLKGQGRVKTARADEPGHPGS